MIEWDDVRVFLAVAECGSIAAAARGIGMSHATVWRRVRSLEAGLGAELFVRSGNLYRLSAAGSALRDRYHDLGRIIAQGVARARSKRSDECGVVRVTGPLILGDVIAGRLWDLIARNRNLVLELIVDSPVAFSADADTDLAISVEPGVISGFVCEASFDLGFSLSAAPRYLEERGVPASATDLSGHRLIDFDPSIRHVGPPTLGAARASGPDIVWRCNSTQARIAAAKAGLGLAFAPEVAVRGDPTLVSVVDSARVGSVPVWLHVNADSRRSPNVLLARNYLVSCLEYASAGVERRDRDAATPDIASRNERTA